MQSALGDVNKVETEQRGDGLDAILPDTLVIPSLNVRQAEVRDVLQGLGVQFSINLLLDPDVAGPISVSLHKIRLKDALRLIASENGYRIQVQHGAIKFSKVVAPPPPPPPAPPFQVTFENNLLSLDVKGIPADQVVRRIVETTGKNVVLDRDAASTSFTALFKNLPLRKGLSVLAENNDLLLRENDGVYTLFRRNWPAGAPGGDGMGMQPSGPMRVIVQDSLISLEISGAPLSQVISSISAQSGVGMVVYGQIQGTATMKLSQVTLDQALQYLLSGTEYTFWKRGGTYFVGSQSMQSVHSSELIVLKHLKADEVMELLPASLQRNSQFKVVKSHNALMVVGTIETISSVKEYVAQIDYPIPQILIEALVVDVDMDKARQIGVNLFRGGMSDPRAASSSNSFYPKYDQSFSAKELQPLIDMIPGISDVVTLPKDFVARVEALEQEKILKIHSRPQIATLNGSEASITVGQTQYFLLKSETDYSQTATTTTRTTERFEKIEANVTLTVTPYVTGKGEITCDIVPDFSEPEAGFSASTPPTLNRRVLKSKVRLRDGETIVLGGLVKESLNSTRDQFPFLGSIPILGWLFKNQNTVKSRSQLIIFVTPHIYFGADANVDVDQYIKKNTRLVD